MALTYEIRNCFIAPPGWKYVSIDYSNLELLSTAHQTYMFYGHSAMRDIINKYEKPTDLHSDFACAIASLDWKRTVIYEEFIENKKKPEYKAYRTKAKPTTLGEPGGLGYLTQREQYFKAGINLKYKVLKKFPSDYAASAYLRWLWKNSDSLNFDIDYCRIQQTAIKEWAVVYDEVVILKKLYAKKYPEVAEFKKEGHKKFIIPGESFWEKNDFGQWEESPYYEYKTHGVIRRYATYCATCNGFLMQTPSAVGAKKAGILLFKEFHNNPDVQIKNFIHDEYGFYMRQNDELYDNIKRASELMLEAMAQTLPSVKIAVEAEMNDHWDKISNPWAKSYYLDGPGLKVKEV